LNGERKLKGTERKIEQYTNPDNDDRGPWVSANMVGLLPKEQRPNCHYDLINPETGINYGKPKLGWRYDKNTMNRLILEKRIIWPDNENGRPRRKVFLNEVNSELPNFTSFIGKNIFTRNGTKEIDELFGLKYFDFPKPSALISELIKQACSESDSDLILDFFAGSGTMAHAVLELNKEDNGNRKFISVQLPEKTGEKSEAFQAGYTTIADIAKERVKRVIQKIKEEKKGQLDFSPQEKQDLGFKVFKLSESNFKIWRSRGIETAEELEKQMALFTDPVSENAAAEPMVYELMLKSGFDLNSPVEHQNGVYRIGNGEMALLIETVSEKLIGEVIQSRPQKVIALDRLFEGNDQLKTNTALQMKDANIDFKTI
jgi:adenine-specific DNA-methyltransferase